MVFTGYAQYVGPPNNVGREYGNPKMPLMVSHLAGANKKRLERANKNAHHSIFGKVLCFRKLCRIQSGHTASLNAISFKTFRKKVARNAKKGAYKNLEPKPSNQPTQNADKPTIKADTIQSKVIPEAVAEDSLIVLNSELLFETNKSTLRGEHFVMLNSIADYLLTHRERSVSISGHTDNTGTEERNVALSKQRAEVVAQYLLKRGISADRMSTSGLGSSKALTENLSESGRMKNRRVELLIYDER